MRVAMCQIPVGDDPKENLEQIQDALARSAGADLAVFPEAAQVRFGNDLTAIAEPLDGLFVTELRKAAREHGMAIIAGVFEPADGGRVHNTAVAIDADGALIGSYRKLHLFDAFRFRESETVAPGDQPVVVELAGVRIGLITCYDIRFPELARALIDRGAELLVIIAAWAQGVYKEEHWTTLAKARAIENTTWVVAVDKAPDLTDPPRGGRTGVGRSLLIDPMGVACHDLGPGAAVRVADIDLDVTAQVRATLPALSHRRTDLLR
ncbi:MAG: carbon-nitrogen hydrolase family protein [Actinomadura sp.]